MNLIAFANLIYPLSKPAFWNNFTAFLNVPWSKCFGWAAVLYGKYLNPLCSKKAF